VWQDKGWIVGPDPRGWFQWYCRYYLGCRLPDIDQHQIKRWRACKRHKAQVRKNCDPGNILIDYQREAALVEWQQLRAA